MKESIAILALHGTHTPYSITGFSIGIPQLVTLCPGTIILYTGIDICNKDKERTYHSSGITYNAIMLWDPQCRRIYMTDSGQLVFGLFMRVGNRILWHA